MFWCREVWGLTWLTDVLHVDDEGRSRMLGQLVDDARGWSPTHRLARYRLTAFGMREAAAGYRQFEPYLARHARECRSAL
jgi:hypothetical protein